jgi:hypothetical protein
VHKRFPIPPVEVGRLIKAFGVTTGKGHPPLKKKQEDKENFVREAGIRGHVRNRKAVKFGLF